MTLILASASAIRRSMLEAAGVAFSVRVAGIDEAAFKDEAAAEIVAQQLADAKAVAVSRDSGDDVVIGSDSLVTVDGRRFDKPATRQQAGEHLRSFSGASMVLTSAVAVARGGRVEWRHVESATLNVRDLSDEFIERYLDAEWPDVSYCVGVFRLEGRGVQLFDWIEGSHFTILGMPLLPLLGELRRRGLAAA